MSFLYIVDFRYIWPNIIHVDTDQIIFLSYQGNCSNFSLYSKSTNINSQFHCNVQVIRMLHSFSRQWKLAVDETSGSTFTYVCVLLNYKCGARSIKSYRRKRLIYFSFYIAHKMFHAWAIFESFLFFAIYSIYKIFKQF